MQCGIVCVATVSYLVRELKEKGLIPRFKVMIIREWKFNQRDEMEEKGVIQL